MQVVPIIGCLGSHKQVVVVENLEIEVWNLKKKIQIKIQLQTQVRIQTHNWLLNSGGELAVVWFENTVMRKEQRNLFESQLFVSIFVSAREQMVHLLDNAEKIDSSNIWFAVFHLEEQVIHLISGNLLIAGNDPSKNLLSVKAGVSILIQLRVKPGRFYISESLLLKNQQTSPSPRSAILCPCPDLCPQHTLGNSTRHLYQCLSPSRPVQWYKFIVCSAHKNKKKSYKTKWLN